MKTDAITQPVSRDDLFVGKSEEHTYYQINNLQRLTDGKAQMYDTLERVILEHAGHRTDGFRFMSMPGRYWRFEFSLAISVEKKIDRPVHFTGFERDYNVIVSGTGYVPRAITGMDYSGHPRHNGFRVIESLTVPYFKTNRARWINMDVNSALTLNNAYFRGDFLEAKKLYHQKSRLGCFCWMEWWLKKFTQWDAVWLDYYGPASSKVGDALAALHYHCRNDVTPVAVTLLKGREFDDIDVTDRKQWVVSQLSRGIGVSFECLHYLEYNDSEGSTMCNIIGLLRR